MPEETVVVDKVNTGLETGNQHFTLGEDYTDLPDEVKQTVAKHESPVETVKAYAELSKKLGTSYRLPDDLATLNADQKADLITKTRSLRSIPATPGEYVINVADGTERDEAFESAFKALAHEKGLSSEDVQSLADFYVNAQNGAQEAYNQKLATDAQAAETEFRMLCGVGYESRMEEIGLCREGLADDLKLAYMDGDQKKSKLDDALDMVDANGKKLGNNPAVLQLLTFVYNKFYRESRPIPGSQAPGTESGGMLSKSFYANPETN